MADRSQLLTLTRQLRHYLEWQIKQGAPGALAAPAEERDAWRERVRQRQSARTAAMRQALRASAPASAPASGTPPQTLRPRPGLEPASPAAMPASPAPAAPLPAPSDAAAPPIWKQFGSRPKPRLEQAPPSNTPSRPEAGPSATPGAPPVTAQEKLAFLRNYMGDCQRCGLCQTRNHIVFGDGSPQARLMFIGEAPGYPEDQRGVPFVGESGGLLERMIGAMGTSRAEVYLANIVKCRPPDNRDPSHEEIARCLPFLKKQIVAVQPQVIVVLGDVAANQLLGLERPIDELRGRWHRYEGIDVMPTFHPEHLLRNPAAKREAWEDLQKVMQRLAEAPRSRERSHNPPG